MNQNQRLYEQLQRQANTAIHVERKNKTIKIKSKGATNNRHVSSLKDINIKKNYGFKRTSDSYNYRNIYEDGKNSY